LGVRTAPIPAIRKVRPEKGDPAGNKKITEATTEWSLDWQQDMSQLFMEELE